MKNSPPITTSPDGVSTFMAPDRGALADASLFANASLGRGRRLRVLMTADVVGGVWSYALQLAQALPEIEFALVTMGSPVVAVQRQEAARLPNLTLFPSSYALEWMDRPWTDVDHAGRLLLEIAASFKPDLVHLNGYAHAALPWNVPVLVVAHSCVFSWWTAVKKSDVPAGFEEYHRRISKGLRAADLVVAPTQAMLDTLAVNYNFTGKAQAIPNARDPELFRPAAKRNLIIGAGRIWDEAKNLKALDAVAEGLPWPIAIAGDASDPNGQSVGLHNVIWLGKLSESAMADHLAGCAIYALPARYEPFGLSALEAGLCGCALVLGNIPSLREVWADAAVFVDPDDHEMLANALKALIKDGNSRRALGERARRRALEFSPSQMAESYRAAYRGLLASSPAAHGPKLAEAAISSVALLG